MSEYQYYEFLAVDRPLTPHQLRQVRHYSSRATLTPTQFVNTYDWGDFRGDPDDFVTRFYDLMLYVANWGTRRLLVGLPADLADPKAWHPYATEDTLNFRTHGHRLLLDFGSDTEEPEDDFDEGAGWMASLAPIRAELLTGDARPLYLAWLAGVPFLPAHTSTAPPPPPGLAELTPAQQTLATFLRVDQDLLAAAAAASPPLLPSDDALAAWISSLSTQEKDRLLLDLATNRDPHLGPKLLRRYQATARTAHSHPRLPLPDLLQTADTLRQKRLAAERERAARERTRRRARESAALERRIETLRANPDAAWQNVEQILHLKESKSYPQAVRTLTDLRELAARDNALPTFTARLAALHRTHRRKHSFIERLRAAGLLAD